MTNVINKSMALELLEGNEPLYLSVVRVFLEDTPLQLSKLEVALAKGDLVVVNRQAHAIKSASQSVGAEKLSNACYTLELYTAESVQKAECERLVGIVMREFQSAKAVLEKWV